MERVSKGLSERLADLDWALSHFTLAADLTTLQEECRLVHSDGTLVARYMGLPFAALSFLGDNPDEVASLAAQLTGPGETFYVLLNEQDRRLAERAFTVEEVIPEWQMLFTGDPAALDPGAAAALGHDDLAQMCNLAADAGLGAFEAAPFRHGPACGVRVEEQLAAMAGTHLCIPGAVEIGNIATHPAHRRQGYARQAVSALVQAHATARQRVFLMVFQTNTAAVRLYEEIGFERLRPMFLMRCRLRPDSHLDSGR